MQWVLDLSVFFQVVLYIMGSVAALAAGIAAIVKLWKWTRKPHEETRVDLASYKLTAKKEHDELQCGIDNNKEDLKRAFGYLDNDKKRLDSYDDSFKMLYKGMWVLLDHKLTGNSDEKMRSIRDELQSHIINS